MDLKHEILPNVENGLSFENFRDEVLKDYSMAITSRQISLLGRKEVLTGKAKFGIFGDGKEVAQVAMAKFFKKGDFRSGYYRDQTLMLALGVTNPRQYFSQLYADTDINNEPFSAGRQMNAHYATPNVDKDGNWLSLVDQYNSTADMAPTAAQMPRSLGLGLASTLFRNNPSLQTYTGLSNNGNEVCFCTIGDASTSEGHFWEVVNAAGVKQVPLVIFVWDDGYGISVPTEYQTIKASISKALKGFEIENGSNGIKIFSVKGWDYAGMCESFEEGVDIARRQHIPVLFHVQELTQPQGHSTSGSHERYKSPERLRWEKDWDCLKKMNEWIIDNQLATEEDLDAIEDIAQQKVKQDKALAWEQYIGPIWQELHEVVNLIREQDPAEYAEIAICNRVTESLLNIKEPLRKDIIKGLYQVLKNSKGKAHDILSAKYAELKNSGHEKYNTYLYNVSPKAVLKVKGVKAEYGDDTVFARGYEVLNKYFDELFAKNPKVVAFGEDLGKIGDVNQGFSGLQQKHGNNRIFDTGIRELSIMGQGIGLALRGLRPIAEIQYLDYLLYALQPLSDDVSSLHYRTAGLQSCPIIVRTRGHRLEGIWHSGSPMGMAVHALRGMCICVPRNMTQAVGMYNTILQANDPALVVESLNGYRLRERLIQNLTQYRVPLGVPEILSTGNDITIVSYGSVLRIIAEVAEELRKENIHCEVIDVQTLLPFDVDGIIIESLKKTSRILFIDEDVPGGASAYMFNHILEKQGGYRFLDAAPRTLTAKAHRPAYGTDGDYFSKPNAEEIEVSIREVISE